MITFLALVGALALAVGAGWGLAQLFGCADDDAAGVLPPRCGEDLAAMRGDRCATCRRPLSATDTQYIRADGVNCSRCGAARHGI